MKVCQIPRVIPGCLVLFAATLASCVVRVQEVQHESCGLVHESITVQTVPPPARVEVIPVAPSPDHVWVAGYWYHHSGNWVWVGGRYVARPHHNAVWVGGRWEAQGGRWR